MRCPECGTKVSRVLETRDHFTMVSRRHECGNGHRFKTVQFHLGMLKHLSKPLSAIRKQLKRGIEQRKSEWDRGAAIARYLRAGHRTMEAASHFGVHRNTIARAKRKHGVE